jgi:hypothetical protein
MGGQNHAKILKKSQGALKRRHMTGFCGQQEAE